MAPGFCDEIWMSVISVIDWLIGEGTGVFILVVRQMECNEEVRRLLLAEVLFVVNKL